jgi:hypothetical protein
MMRWHLQWNHSLAVLLIALMSYSMPAQKANGGSARVKEATDAGNKTLPQASRVSEGSLAGDIKVHGHWKIVIRNPDGSIASHHEFENSLSWGGQALAGVLTHTLTIGPWAVILHSACGLSGFPAACAIQEANAPALSGSEAFSNLTVQLGGSAPHQDIVILTGSAKSTQGGTISEVDTTVTTCAPTTLASACGPLGSHSQRFTSQTISPLTVQPGQTIDVTVQLSFS